MHRIKRKHKFIQSAVFDERLVRRNCIGTYFAMAEAVIVMSQIVQSFWLQPLPGQGFPVPDTKITLRPGSVNLNLIKR